MEITSLAPNLESILHVPIVVLKVLVHYLNEQLFSIEHELDSSFYNPIFVQAEVNEFWTIKVPVTNIFTREM